MRNPGLPVLDVDPFSPALLRGPQRYYAALRARGEAVWLPRYGVCASGRIDVVEAVFRDWRTFSSARGVGLSDFAREPPWRPPSLILEVDPPAHERTRRIMARALSPAAVNALKPRFEAAAARLVDSLPGRIDAVRDVAEAYPLEVFGDAVGIARDGRRQLLRYGAMVFNALGPDNAVRREALADAREVAAWIDASCARDALTADGFGATIHAAADRGEVSPAEATLLVRSLLSAGIDTTVATLANLLHCLATHPAQWARLRAEPALAPAAIDEALRHSSPVHTFCRTLTRTVELGGAELVPGTKILCVMGAANRDPARWADADRFDITRPCRPHVAFGSGIHVCVGQHVARQEIAALVTALVGRIDTLALAGRPEWRANNAVHSLACLPLTLGRAVRPRTELQADV
jgi:cytochrome P450